MKDYSKNEKEWKKFQERVKEANKYRDKMAVYFAVAKINIKIKEVNKK